MKVNNKFPAHQKGTKYAADKATNQVADCIQKLGVKYTSMAREIGISEGILRRSLIMRERSLRADEFLAICRFLGREPFDFAEENQPLATVPHPEERREGA